MADSLASEMRVKQRCFPVFLQRHGGITQHGCIANQHLFEGQFLCSVVTNVPPSSFVCNFVSFQEKIQTLFHVGTIFFLLNYTCQPKEACIQYS